MEIVFIFNGVNMEDDICFEQIDREFLESDETYACSQGMFGDDNNETEPLIMGGYIMDDKSEENFFEYNDDEEYIFIRLIKAVYKNSLNPANILGKFINFVDNPIKRTNMIYNHATISTDLKDNFYGLTTGSGKEMDFKIESVLRPENNRYLNGGNQNLSEFAVYGLKVKKSEYANVKNFLNLSLKNGNLVYNVFDLPLIGMKAFKDKMKMQLDKIFKKSTEDQKNEDINKITNKMNSLFVCSTLVSYIIWKFTNIGKLMDKKNLQYGNCTPDDLVNKIPKMHFLFNGKWTEYNYKVMNFIAKHDNFKKYFNNGDKKK